MDTAAVVQGREALREAVRCGLGVGYGLPQELGDPTLRAVPLRGGRVVLARRRASEGRRALAARWELVTER